MRHEGLGTMVSGADGDALAIEQGAEVVGMQAVYHKGDHTHFLRSGADDAQPRKGLQGLVGVLDQGTFVGVDGVEAYPVHPVQGDAQCNAAGDVRCPGFEFVGEVVVGGAVEGDAPDHFATTAPGGHGVKEVPASPEEADAGGSIGFVCGGDIEVAADGGDVDGQMGQGLGAVHEGDRSGGACCGAELGDGVDGAEGVRSVDDADHFGLVALQFPGEVFKVEGAILPHVYRHQLSAFLFAHHLPRDDVGVVLHLGHQHGVSGAEVGAAPGLGDEVDPVRGAGCEDDFFGGLAANVVRDFPPGTFIGFRGQLGQMVCSAVDVGVVVREVFALSLDDGQRLLGTGGIVEVDQRLAVDAPVEDRKVASNAFGQGGIGHFNRNRSAK